MPTLFCGCDPEAGHVCDRHVSLSEPPVVASSSNQFPQENINGVWVPASYPPFSRQDVKAETRKTYPVASGVLDYFPLAIMEVAHVSYVGQQQHQLTGPLHWDRSKSGDEADALMRHFLARGIPDTDGISHTAKVAWRALALLQKELEQRGK